MSGRILVISAHPDDETLGCGGTLLKQEERGDETCWLILTDVHESVGYSKEFISERKSQIAGVAQAFSFADVYNLGYPTTRLHAADFSELISAIASVVSKVRPEVIYTVNRSDVHTDHQVGAKAVMSCTKSFRYPFIERILMYECVSETEMAAPLVENVFIPNVFSDISDYLDRKIEIMQLYGSEVQEPPLPRSIDNVTALARFRGASAGVNYAEAFTLIRDLF